MDEKLQQQANELTKEIMHGYFCDNDITILISVMGQDIVWLGAGENQFAQGKDAVSSAFQSGLQELFPCRLSDISCLTFPITENSVLCMYQSYVDADADTSMHMHIYHRASFLFQYIDNKLQLVHIHHSCPLALLEEDELFPADASREAYLRLEHTLSDRERQIELMLEQLPGGMITCMDDENYTIQWASDNLYKLFGYYSIKHFLLSVDNLYINIILPRDREKVHQTISEQLSHGNSYQCEYRIISYDGNIHWILESGKRIDDGTNQGMLACFLTDITALKQVYFELKVERERYRIALESVTGVMCEYDIVKDIFIVYQREKSEENDQMKKREYPSFSQLLFAGSEMTPEESENFFAACTGKITDPIEFNGHFFIPKQPNKWIELKCSIILDVNGVPVRSIGLLKDISVEKIETMKLMEQTRRDGLTQLLNQISARESAQEYLNQCNSHDRRNTTLLILDLDNFKDINDTYGHTAGDDVLIQTARILEDVAGDDSIVGRVGGDEFFALLKGLSATQAIPKANEIIKRMHTISSGDGHSVTSSLGIADCCGSNESFSDLFIRANKALYCAKDSGRNQWSIYSES